MVGAAQSAVSSFGRSALIGTESVFSAKYYAPADAQRRAVCTGARRELCTGPMLLICNNSIQIAFASFRQSRSTIAVANERATVMLGHGEKSPYNTRRKD